VRLALAEELLRFALNRYERALRLHLRLARVEVDRGEVIERAPQPLQRGLCFSFAETLQTAIRLADALDESSVVAAAVEQAAGVISCAASFSASSAVIAKPPAAFTSASTAANAELCVDPGGRM
jgi:hypothetical protein